MKKTSPLAIASLITGIIGFPLFCCCFLIPIPIGAVIMGHIARHEIKKDPQLEGEGLALAGLILGYVDILIFISYFILSLLIGLGKQINTTFDKINVQLQTNTPPAHVQFVTPVAPVTPDTNTMIFSPYTNAVIDTNTVTDTNAAPSTNAP